MTLSALLLQAVCMMRAILESHSGQIYHRVSEVH